MADRQHRLAFIGGGNMAEAIISGLLDRGVYTAAELAATDVVPARLEFLSRTFAIATSDDNRELIRSADAVLFAVKPQNMGDVLAGIAADTAPDQLFLSICAGTTTAFIENGLRTPHAPTPRVIRIMPNTPALIGLGVAGICKGTHATDADLDVAERIFKSVGIVLRVAETQMDAVTALTGSGPAYVFYLIEALIEAGVKVGFTPEQAHEMVTQMVLGSATLARKSDKSAADLRRAVTSPGGTTAAGVAVLDEKKVMEAFIACVAAAEARGRELGGGR